MSEWRFTIWTPGHHMVAQGTFNEFLPTLRRVFGEQILEHEDGQLHIQWTHDQAGTEDPAPPREETEQSALQP